MLYVKNLPIFERLGRGGLAVVAIALSYHYLGLTPLGLGADVTAAMIALTGVLGFCPACAMAGRKLHSGSK